jgi:Raf kinase inhibitor-like YbhB/YbcL family protein
MPFNAPLNPYTRIADVPGFTVVSSDISDGTELPRGQRSGIFGAGGSDTSPHLSWQGFPSGTKSFAVTVLDPAAPTGSGFWHWALFNIPAHVTSLASGAADNNGAGLPDGSLQLKNDAGFAGFLGAAPPAGSGRHPYHFGIHALDVAFLELDADATPAFLGFNMSARTLARAVITPWYEVD